jgi:hypothetical protein
VRQHTAPAANRLYSMRDRGITLGIGTDGCLSSDKSRKAEEVFGEWNINDIRSKEEIWKKNGGEIITMSPDESKRYVDAVSPVAASIL